NNEVAPTPTTIEPSLTVGIDLGISHLLNLSDGNKFDNPKHLSKSSQRLSGGGSKSRLKKNRLRN
ncbi:transposase, partial [Psychrobacter piechaudii]|uniref:transposase n=1 Tax=Psychrobacter piechaudii TaxID=1945521 RepID=UPI001FCA2ECB